MPHEKDLDKAALFRELGFGGDTAPYEAALQEEGISKPAKGRIAAAKRARVQEILEARFARVCGRGDCQLRKGEVAPPRTPVLAAGQEFCEFCGGSGDRAALEQMIGACERAGVGRLCIVGGSPGTRDRIRRVVGKRLGLELVDGTVSHTLKQAESNSAWADLVVVWGSTELDHKVSTLYRGPKVILVAKRGLQELARNVVQACASR